MTIVAFLMGLGGSLVARILITLGVGFISYSAFQVALDAVRGKIETAWSQGGAIFDMLYLAGMGHAVGIILSAFAAKGVLYSIKKFGKLAA